MADVLATLALLGGTANDIAASLTNKGIVGERHESTSCPIARFLAEQGFVGVAVAPHKVFFDSSAMALPDYVAEFIRHFDAGEWPELVETA